MTLDTLITVPESTRQIDLSHIPEKKLSEVGTAMINLMNVSGVMTKGATHYNSKEDLEKAMKQAHREVFEIDRGIYLLIHALDGVTDFSIQKAVAAMLANSWDRFDNSVFDIDLETRGLAYLTHKLPANRMINLFNELRDLRINNTRTKKRVILPIILGSKNLEWWAVKYRRKVRKALEHAWDKKTTGILKSILGKIVYTERFNDTLLRLDQKEVDILQDEIGDYLLMPKDGDFHEGLQRACQSVFFILGGKGPFTMPILKAFEEAKGDIELGKELPAEVLEGIRSTYHKKVTQKKILKLTKDKMTNKQKMKVQKKSDNLKVKVDFNPMTQNVVDLYKMTYQVEMTDEILKALQAKARKAAEQIPVRFEKVGILLDTSFSMVGSKAQNLRPMAVALGLRDMLHHVGSSVTHASTGDAKSILYHPTHPTGGTGVANALVDLIEAEVDVVFIISDGYENSPSGRVHEVVQALRRMKINTPIYHMNPVAGAEAAKNLRSFSPDIPTLPISNPQALGLMLFRAMLEVDVRKGIQALASIALPRIENGRRKEVAHA